MTSTGAMSKFLHTLSMPRSAVPRPQTPDLTPLDAGDAPAVLASPLLRTRSERPVSLEGPKDCVQATERFSLEAPSRPPPPPPALHAFAEGVLVGSSAPVGPVAFKQTAARDQPVMQTPLVTSLPPVEPLRLASSAHQWWARYILDGPAPYGFAQLLAEDMLGAGILGASVTGALPLVQGDNAADSRPFEQFKKFVGALTRWVDEAPKEKRAMYEVFAMRLGRVRMHYARTLEVACLGVETLPSVLGECTQLQKIDARHNALTTLPSSLSKLQALRELNLEDNLFTRVPDVLAQMSLDVLRLHVVGGPAVQPSRPAARNLAQPGWL